jgi:L-ascorbate metabolism protein UlaG (beta-lactamase superfamily)
MFDIEYKGGNTVVISTKKASVVFDPKLSILGLKDAGNKDDIQAATETRFALPADTFKLSLDSPGEYETADIALRGVAARRHIDAEGSVPASTMYQFEIGTIKGVVIGNIDAKLDDDQLEAIGVVDIVIIPVGGGGYTLDATAAASLVRKLEPKAVIPVHYADDALSYEVPQDTLETFTSELGAPVEESVSKYRIKAVASLPQVYPAALAPLASV